jgi:hypothetical protein
MQRCSRPNWGWWRSIVCCPLLLPFVVFGRADGASSKTTDPGTSRNTSARGNQYVSDVAVGGGFMRASLLNPFLGGFNSSGVQASAAIAVSPAEAQNSAPAAGGEAARSNASTPAAGGNAGLLPPGPGRDLTLKVCSNCHEPSVIAKQRMSKQDWSDVVKVMHTRGAVATDEEFSEITVYLAKAFPTDRSSTPAAGQNAAGSSSATPDASLFPPGPGRDLTLKVCSNCHAPVIMAKQRMSKQDWDDVVQVMSARGAVATDKELSEITDYLAKAFPADKAPHR